MPKTATRAAISGTRLRTNISGTQLKCFAVRDQSRGLVIRNNGANPDHQIDIEAKEVILQDDNFNAIRVTGLNLTLDIEGSGVNGLDSGTEIGDRWYYVWVIGKTNGSVAGLFSTSSKTPTLPSGYRYKAFVGAAHNCRNSGNDFGPLCQVGNTVARNAVAVVNARTATSPTAIDCSGAIPDKAVCATGDLTLNIAAGGGRGAAWIRSGPDHGCIEFAGYLNTQGRLTVPFRIPIIESQTVYFNVDPTSKTESVTISISGFEY